MLHKVNTLAAALELGTFRVEDLSAKSGASPSTVYSVLRRAPSDWFTSEVAASGQRGGQPKQFRLSPAGVAAIGSMLGELPVPLRQSALDASPSPLGLLAAEQAVPKIAKVRPEVAAQLRLQAESNLVWAEAEVGSMPPESDVAPFLARIATARRHIDIVSALRSTA